MGSFAKKFRLQGPKCGVSVRTPVEFMRTSVRYFIVQAEVRAVRADSVRSPLQLFSPNYGREIWGQNRMMTTVTTIAELL